MADEVLFEQAEGIGIATINKPKANQLSHGVFEGLRRILNSCAQDKNLRVLVLTNSGDKIFCAGADLSSGFGDLGPLDYLKRGQDLNDKIESMPIPVIAAMNGHAFGGGLEMAMACHLRYLKKGARVGLTETNLGIIPGYGGTLRLQRLVGRARALEYILLGEQIEAEEALRIGLINGICEEEEVLSKALDMARKLAQRPPLSVRRVLKIMAMSPSISPEQHLKIEREALVELFGTKDMIEGMTAFAQKRPPVFKGE
ncbi:MAG: enoyl-CoA hydratase-related protein [Desulfobacteraceae bacterium]|nr:enoyl-CoA hydratase-related protein [Desulfobacteraceae bacterium]